MIVVKLKGDFYALDTFCDTLKEFMEVSGVKRSQIAAWWKREEAFQNNSYQQDYFRYL